MAEIYQLNAFQYDSLYRMANDEHQLLACLGVLEDDEPEVKERLGQQAKDASHLITLGLIEDISPKLTEQLFTMELKTGRKPTLYIITTIGFDMFNGPKKRKIN